MVKPPARPFRSSVRVSSASFAQRLEIFQPALQRRPSTSPAACVTTGALSFPVPPFLPVSRPAPLEPPPAAMLVLFESAVGLCLFKMKDGKLDDKELYKQFETPEEANNL